MNLDTNKEQPFIWENYSNGSARSTMINMGYKGGGLGRNENGREEALGVQGMRSTEKAIIFSSSITRGVKPNGFNKLYKGVAKFERFNGRTIHDIKSYIPVHLQREQYDSAVIVAGGNDLSKGNIMVDTVAQDIIEAGLVCREHMVRKVYICSVLPRRNARYQERRETLNMILKELCKIFGFVFIGNENITLQHIDRDNVHLNESGSSNLCRNVVRCLNDN